MRLRSKDTGTILWAGPSGIMMGEVEFDFSFKSCTDSSGVRICGDLNPQSNIDYTKRKI